MGFRVLVVGGTGQVGSGLVRALLATSSCTEVVMVNRRTIPLAADARLRQVIVDTSAANFAGEIAEVAKCSVQGEPLYAASCIGIAALFATVIGTLLGAAAGFYCGWLDTVVMRISEFFQVIPGFVLAAVIVAMTGTGLAQIVAVVSLLAWPQVARFLFNAWWLSFFPGTAIFVTVLAFNLFGDAVGAVLNPRAAR